MLTNNVFLYYVEGDISQTRISNHDPIVDTFSFNRSFLYSYNGTYYSRSNWSELCANSRCTV